MVPIVRSFVEKWTYYDFDKNWSTVWKLWNTDEVQDVLEEQMGLWGVPYNDVKPWKRGDSLWKYSRTDYWANKIMCEANEYVEENRMVHQYAKTMRDLGFKLSKEQVEEGFSQTCLPEIEEKFDPKHGTLESIILIMGKNSCMPC